MINILISYRADGTVQATLETNSDIWRTGKDENAAVGALIWYEREKFGIDIIMPPS
jgi:hypothetical protein